MEKYIKGVKVATTTNTKSDINSKRIIIKHPQPKKLTKLELKQILATKVSPKLTSDERSIQTILHKDDVISIDYEKGIIINKTRGEQYAAQPIPPHIAKLVNLGGLIPYLEHWQEEHRGQ